MTARVRPCGGLTLAAPLIGWLAHRSDKTWPFGLCPRDTAGNLAAPLRDVRASDGYRTRTSRCLVDCPWEPGNLTCGGEIPGTLGALAITLAGTSPGALRKGPDSPGRSRTPCGIGNRTREFSNASQDHPARPPCGERTGKPFGLPGPSPLRGVSRKPCGGSCDEALRHAARITV